MIRRRHLQSVEFLANQRVKVKLPQDKPIRGILLWVFCYQTSAGGAVNGTPYPITPAQVLREVAIVAGGANVLFRLPGIVLWSIQKYIVREPLWYVTLANELVLPNRLVEGYIPLDLTTNKRVIPDTALDCKPYTNVDLEIQFCDPQTDLFLGGDRTRTMTGSVHIYIEELVDGPIHSKTRYFTPLTTRIDNVLQDIPLPIAEYVRLWAFRTDLDRHQLGSDNFDFKILADKTQMFGNVNMYSTGAVGFMELHRQFDAWRSGDLGQIADDSQTDSMVCFDFPKVNGTTWVPKAKELLFRLEAPPLPLTSEQTLFVIPEILR